jgi:hypothetical protein
MVTMVLWIVKKKAVLVRYAFFLISPQTSAASPLKLRQHKESSMWKRSEAP